MDYKVLILVIVLFLFLAVLAKIVRQLIRQEQELTQLRHQLIQAFNCISKLSDADLHLALEVKRLLVELESASHLPVDNNASKSDVV